MSNKIYDTNQPVVVRLDVEHVFPVSQVNLGPISRLNVAKVFSLCFINNAIPRLERLLAILASSKFPVFTQLASGNDPHQRIPAIISPKMGEMNDLSSENAEVP